MHTRYNQKTNSKKSGIELMIKEIQKISKEMVTLNDNVYGAILSAEDLQILENNIIIIKSVQKNINSLIDKAFFISSTNTDQLIISLTKIYQLLSQQAIAVEAITALSDKFICNYREEWNIIQKNVA